MEISFFKYQGAGNDFIMLDNLSGVYDSLSIRDIEFLCNRKMGVGADGLIKLSHSDKLDFNVEYFNADGSQSFCGNGARCAVAFAASLNLFKQETSFDAIDGRHKAKLINGLVRLEMLDVEDFSESNGDYILDTGSPHYVHFSNDKETLNIVDYGKSIRYNQTFKKHGINVNVVKILSTDKISVETYERGVEDETLSCGTGVTACALMFMNVNNLLGESKVFVQTKGGSLEVEAKFSNNQFSSIWLTGPADYVYNGKIVL